MGNEETIVALATPPGIGALAIIRISGKDAFKICKKIVIEEQKFESFEEKKVGLFTVKNKNAGKIIDEVTIIKYIRPKTYTGENLIEIMTHGGIYTVNNVIKEILKNGARIAERGEFTKRAFLNGKINLIKAEAIKNIIESQSEAQYIQGISSYFKHEKKIKVWQEKIIDELTYMEAEIQFGEEERLEKREKTEIIKLEKEISEEIDRSKNIENDYNGIDVVICGPSNAGKSSFFNYLLGQKRAIVNKQKGTTRDIISEKITIDEKEINLFDTAGIRETECEIEKEGIEKTKEILNKNNIKIWITDISECLSEEEKKWINKIDTIKTIYLLNKSDKKKNYEKELYYKTLKGQKIVISLKDKKNTDQIIKRIKEIVKKTQLTHRENSFINQRQLKIAEKTKKRIKTAIVNWEQKEIASYYLRESLDAFNELLGKTEEEKIINDIFNKFCIGK